MLPDTIHIVFDIQPKGTPLTPKYKLTVGVEYEANVINRTLGLYQLHDDNGTAFNVSTWGRSYTNGGNWHIKESYIEVEED